MASDSNTNPNDDEHSLSHDVQHDQHIAAYDFVDVSSDSRPRALRIMVPDEERHSQDTVHDGIERSPMTASSHAPTLHTDGDRTEVGDSP